MYPDIGMKYRPEPEEVHQYFRINSFIKVTSGAEKRTFPSAAADETEEQVEPELTQKPSSTETAAEISLEEGYKEIKFPSLGMIKEKLLLGSSTIGSETDSFHVQTIFGIFLGFSFTEDFDLKMIGVGISGSNGSYGLCGFFKVMVEGNKNIPIFLKSAYRQENGYRVRGGTQVKDGNFYMVSDPEQIRIMKV